LVEDLGAGLGVLAYAGHGAADRSHAFDQRLIVLADGFDAVVEGVEGVFVIGGGVGDLFEYVGEAMVVDVVALELFADDFEGFGLHAGVFGDGLEGFGEVLEQLKELVLALGLAVEVFLDGGHELVERSEAFLELDQCGVAAGPGFEEGGDGEGVGRGGGSRVERGGLIFEGQFEHERGARLRSRAAGAEPM
jgi:hypothetical protein